MEVAISALHTTGPKLNQVGKSQSIEDYLPVLLNYPSWMLLPYNSVVGAKLCKSSMLDRFRAYTKVITLFTSLCECLGLVIDQSYTQALCCFGWNKSPFLSTNRPAWALPHWSMYIDMQLSIVKSLSFSFFWGTRKVIYCWVVLPTGEGLDTDKEKKPAQDKLSYY